VPAIPRLGAPVNPPPPPVGPTWILRVPKLGLTSEVRAGNSNAVCNAGFSWHWTGTGYLGQEAHVASFAHRTSAGGPYRNINLLSAGDQFTLSTSDGRTYTYQVVDRFLTDSNTQHILDATRFVGGTTFSLIACTQPNFQPTSTAWRIVVTGVLLGWS
jgi:sortase (surface protein transpeptidase)